MRYSKQRETVYNVLCNMHTHPNVSAIYQEARKVMPNVSLGTVYRNLEALCQCGRAQKIGVEGWGTRFDAQVQPHAHFVCTKCGRVVDVAAPQVPSSCEAGSVQRADITLYGVCNKCR